MLLRVLLAAALAAAATPAAASAATISTSPSRTDYDAAPGEQISMLVYGGFDTDLNATAIFFLPTAGNPVDPTTSDASCIARPTGASSCVARARTRLAFAERDDFASVGAAGDLVELRMGAGADRVFVTAGTKLEAYGEGGADDLAGGPGFDILDGGPGNDLLTPVSFGDVVTGGDGFDTVRYSGSTEPVVVTLDDVANDGRRATPMHIADNQNVKADVEEVVGGTVDDELEGNAQVNTLRGGDGADAIDGGGGGDTLLGDAGNDTISARDGVADTIDCGPGVDSTTADAADAVTSCETVTLPDDDADGVRQPFDCDDANPAVKPGAAEVAGDGIDQDCSGADDALPPASLPGPPPPGAGPPPAPSRVESPLLARWALGARATRIIQLDVRDIPAGGAVEVRCTGSGCPFTRRSLQVKRGGAKLGALFARARLKPGAIVEVRISAPGTIGKVVRYRFRSKRRLPTSERLCLAPGNAKPAAC